MSGITVSLSGTNSVRRALSKIISPETKRELTRHVAQATLEKVRGWISEVAPHHHKVANRLGATPTGHLEYADGRTDIKSIDNESFTISIDDTPGLKRAFGDVTITPKRAKALTIPIHGMAYGKRVGELKSDGHVLFRISSKKGNAILAEKDGTKKGIRPLYVLVKKAVIPKDDTLLPKREDYVKWANGAVRGFMKSLEL